jgi:hypothetical protein
MEVCNRRWPVHVFCVQKAAALFLTVPKSAFKKRYFCTWISTPDFAGEAGKSQQGELIGHA